MKIAKKLLLILMSAIMIIGGGGCSMFVSESQLKKTLENSLQEKYDEEFSCLDVWSNGGNSYWGVCSPERNHDIRFKSLFLSGGVISFDGYYSACVAEKIEEDVQKKLESVFSDFYLHSYMTVPLVSREVDDIYAENVRNESFDIDEYVNLANEKWKNEAPSMSFYLCVNTSKSDKLNFEREYDMLSDIFPKFDNMGIGTIVYLKFMPEHKYLECIEYLETRAYAYSTFDDMVRDYPVKVSDVNLNISFEGEDATYVLITKEEYIKQRKEVN